MQVIKRNGRREEVKFDKLIDRVKLQSRDIEVDAAFLAQQVIQGFHDGISTRDIDNYLAETSAVLSTEHYHYAKLAARIAISRLHKETSYSFMRTTDKLLKSEIVSHEYYSKAKKFHKEIDTIIDYKRDFDFDYFGFKTLERSYLLKVQGMIVERPQHLFMRVAVELCDEIKDIKILYECLSKGIYTHATPTLFNAGTTAPQLSSCFLQAISGDSIEQIFDTVKECALISKYAGGIGLHISNVRAKGSFIKGTNGYSNGLVPMIKVFNETARYVDQGGNKRKGAFAIYLEPWHADVEDFLELKKPTGKDELRARDIFLALWIPDLFMQRVKDDKAWSLFSPDTAKGLAECYGDEFKELYERYELTKPCKRVKARDIWTKIIESQLESGVPYILFKDACNEKSNQKNLGTIKSSNLCVEVLQFSSQHETAVCNLASICLPKFVKNNTFDFKSFHEFVKIAAKNLDRVIDKNYYPTKKTELSNLTHRPIGLGVQGLCDVFFQMGLAYDSDECKALDEKIFAAMYYAALEASCEIAKEHGYYKSFKGSPASEGKLQFDLWKKKGHPDFDWKKLRTQINKHGLRNSLSIALMPTASTSQIFGNTECFELPTSNLYKRQTLSGEFVVVNKYLVKELQKLGVWNSDIREQIIANNGSIKTIEAIPDSIKNIYRTVWEVSQREVIDHAAIRAPYICQSQSMNLFFSNPSAKSITSALFYAWEKGLKTGCYYTRTRAAVNAAKVTTKIISQDQEQTPEQISCSLENPESCVMCQ